MTGADPASFAEVEGDASFVDGASGRLQTKRTIR